MPDMTAATSFSLLLTLFGGFSWPVQEVGCNRSRCFIWGFEYLHPSSLIFSRPRFSKWRIMLNQAVCSKRSGVSSPRSFFSQRSSTSRRTTAGLCSVDGIPSRASLIRLAFSASSATLNSMSLTILNFMFFFIQIPLQARSNWITTVIFAVVGAIFDVKSTHNICKLFFL